MNFVQDLREELTANPAPPRDVVAAALRMGRRARRRRWAAGAGAGLVLVATTALAVPAVLDRSGQQAALDGLGIVAVPASGPKVQATPAGVLEVLRYLLPAGAHGDYEGTFDSDMIIVTTEFTIHAIGTGEIIVNVTHRPGSHAQAAGSSMCPNDFAAQCQQVDLDDGTRVVVLHVDGNCTETTTVTAVRPTDTSVTVFVPSCLASTTDAPQLLTVDEAVAVALNPALDWTMAFSLVEDGSRRYPGLPSEPS